MIDFVTIPKIRLKKFREVKKKLEDLAEVKIDVDDEAKIEGEDPIRILRVKQAIKAFGRGFDFDDALNLLDEDFNLEVIDIKQFSGKSRRRLVTLRGRAIGTGGRTKRQIERLAEVKIAIYGKTISIIGKWDKVMLARQALEMLLSGSLHKTVYKFLERKM